MGSDPIFQIQFSSSKGILIVAITAERKGRSKGMKDSQFTDALSILLLCKIQKKRGIV